MSACAAGICGVRAARQGECAVVLHQNPPAVQSHRVPVHLQASQVHVRGVQEATAGGTLEEPAWQDEAVQAHGCVL